MNHKYRFIIASILIFVAFQHIESRQFPLKSVSQPSCKNLEWKDHNDNCKIDISTINTSNLTALSPVGKLVYSMLWGASYTYQRDSLHGGHPGIDIASAKGTPVYAIGPGKVARIGVLNGYGNSITIQHRYKDTIIYSHYNHLSKVLVSQGDILNEGDNIGEIGNSGTSMGKYGNHLDFQISNNKRGPNPYGYGDCKDGYMSAVNNGTCREKMKKYTIDPFKFFQQEQNKEIIEHRNSPAIEITNKSIQTSVPDLIRSEQKVENDIPIITQDVYSITSKLKTLQQTLTIGKVTKLTLQIRNQQGERFSGKLDKKITVFYNTTYISISPASFQKVFNGEKVLFIRTKKAGKSTIKVYYGEKQIDDHTIEIQ